MNTVLVSTAIWMFLFRKLATWKWFVALRKRFHVSLEYLWKGWTDCAYCGAFWIALVVRGVTGLHSVDFPKDAPLLVLWVLDALATAIGVLLVVRILDALGAYVRLSQKQDDVH